MHIACIFPSQLQLLIDLGDTFSVRWTSHHHPFCFSWAEGISLPLDNWLQTIICFLDSISICNVDNSILDFSSVRHELLSFSSKRSGTHGVFMLLTDNLPSQGNNFMIFLLKWWTHKAAPQGNRKTMLQEGHFFFPTSLEFCLRPFSQAHSSAPHFLFICLSTFWMPRCAGCFTLSPKEIQVSLNNY